MEKLGDGVKKVLLAGIGAVAVTAEKSRELLDEMVKKGELTVEQGKVLNEELKHNIDVYKRQTTGIPGALKAIWISVGCRILIGVVAGWLWILLSKLKVSQVIALPIVGFIGSMVNTVAVMGSIYLLFAQQYAQAREVGVTAVWGLIMGTVTASGIPEAIAAAVLVLALGKVLIQVFKKMNIGMMSTQLAK